MKKECSILVTSCDKYEDAWKPFFSLLNIMWPTCPYRIYLNTETKNHIEKIINVVFVDFNGGDESWQYYPRFKYIFTFLLYLT